jgi:hypothetical protein
MKYLYVVFLMAVMGFAVQAIPPRVIDVPPIGPVCHQVSGFDKKDNAIKVVMDKVAYERTTNIVNGGKQAYEFPEYNDDFVYVFYFAGFNRPVDIELSKVYQRGFTVFVEVKTKTSDHVAGAASPFLFFKIKKTDLNLNNFPKGKSPIFQLIETVSK